MNRMVPRRMDRLLAILFYFIRQHGILHLFHQISNIVLKDVYIEVRKAGHYHFLLLGIVVLIVVISFTYKESEAGNFIAQPFESLPRKDLSDYDQEILRCGIASNERSRSAFVEGLSRLSAYDLQSARKAFSKSRKFQNTYNAMFNEALAHQLDLDLSGARKLYLEAGKLERTDPMREINLARLLSRIGNRQEAFEALRSVLNSGLSIHERGLVLFHKGFIHSWYGDYNSAQKSMSQSERAFIESSDRVGVAVTRAKQGAIQYNLGQSNEGESLLVDAITELENIGAYADEAVACADLASEYLDEDRLRDAKRILDRGVESARRVGAVLPLARAMNNLGLYHLKKADFVEAKRYLELSLDKFRIIRDKQGEAEAVNNLGVVAFLNEDYEKAFAQFDSAIRIYRKAFMKPFAFEKALTISEFFAQINQTVSAQYFLEIASGIGPRNEIDKGRLLLTFGRILLNNDPSDAKDAFRKALTIFEKQEQKELIEITIKQIETAKWMYYVSLFYYIIHIAIGISFLWILYDYRIHLKSILIRLWRILGIPIRFINNFWQTDLNRWVREKFTLTSEEERIIDFQNEYRLRLVRGLFIFAIVYVFFFDAIFITYPQVQLTNEAKSIIENWPLPPGVRGHLLSLISKLRFYALVRIATQAIIFALWLAVAFLIYDIVDRGIQGAVPRLMDIYYDKVDPSFRIQFYRKMQIGGHHQLRTISLITPILLMLCGFSTQIRLFCDAHKGLILLSAVVVSQLIQFKSTYTLICMLPRGERSIAFDWLHRISFYKVVSIFLNILIFTYIITPAFYIATREVQNRIIHKYVKETSEKFYNLLFKAVKQHGYIILEGKTAFLFTSMEQAFDPQINAGQLWPKLMLPLLRYFFFSWALVFFIRLILPWALSFPERKDVLKVIKISLIVAVIGVALKFAITKLFRVENNYVTITILIFIIIFLTKVYLKQNMTRKVVCPNNDCKSKNSSEAKFCQNCGEYLEEIKQGK